MRVEIDFSKSLEKNAEDYFLKSKKAKKKLAGLKEATAKLELQARKLQEQAEKKEAQSVPALKRKRDWFEKFRWFYTSDNLLVIGGRDAKTNDWIVKKFLDSGDLYFHADVLGAPHCVLKTEKNSASEQSKQEALSFAVVFSRAWQSGVSFADAYWVLPSQVSKKAPSGESMGKGAFMIYGERHFGRKIPLECGVGLEQKGGFWRVVSGPFFAVQTHAAHCVKIVPGELEKSEAAKKLLLFFSQQAKQKLPLFLLDELIAMLPTGKSRLAK